MIPPQPLKTPYFNNPGSLLGVPGPLRHAQYHCVKFSLWETPYSPCQDHFCVPCWHPKCKFLLMKFCYLGREAIYRVDFWSFITAGYTSSGELTFCEFVDCRLFICIYWKQIFPSPPLSLPSCTLIRASP